MFRLHIDWRDLRRVRARYTTRVLSLQFLAGESGFSVREILACGHVHDVPDVSFDGARHRRCLACAEEYFGLTKREAGAVNSGQVAERQMVKSDSHKPPRSASENILICWNCLSYRVVPCVEGGLECLDCLAHGQLEDFRGVAENAAIVNRRRA